MNRFLYWTLELVSLVLAVDTGFALINWGFGVWEWFPDVWNFYNWTPERMMDLLGIRMQTVASCGFALATGASILAAHVAKKLGPEMYQWFNDHVHKWCVVVGNGLMFLALGAAAYGLREWWVFAGLVSAGALYVVFTKVIRINPHSFGARVRSVVLIRLPIGVGIGALPAWSEVSGIIILLTLAMCMMAVYKLWEDKDKFGWPTR